MVLLFSLSLKPWHVGWCSRKAIWVGSTHSCIMSQDDMQRVGGILWMLFYDGYLQEINQYDVFMVSLRDICVFRQTLSRTPHQVLMSTLWESHVDKNSFVFDFCVLWLLYLFFVCNWLFSPLCVFHLSDYFHLLSVYMGRNWKRKKKTFFLQSDSFYSCIKWLFDVLLYFCSLLYLLDHVNSLNVQINFPVEAPRGSTGLAAVLPNRWSCFSSW